MKKKKLPKYAYGIKKPITSRAISNDPNYSPDEYETESSDQIQYEKNKRLAKYATIGTSLAGGIANTYSNLNNPDASLRKKGESLDGATMGVATAINPLVGGIIGGVNLIAKPVRTNAEQTDENGNLVNRRKARNTAILGSLLDPIKALTTRASYKGGFSDLSGEGYLNKLEEEAKAALPEQEQPTYTHDYTQDAVWQRLNNYQQYAMGGIYSGIPNSSVEKEEVIQNPDGTTQQVNVGTHESGNDIQVNLDPGARVFSDRLKLPGSKKTIAKEAERYKTNKEDKVLSNPKSSSTATNTAKLVSDMKQRKLDELFQAQEELKQAKVLNYAKKLGVDLGEISSDESQENEFKNGGIYIKPSHRGRFTEYKKRTGKTTEEALHSKDPHVRKMAQFAKNAKKWKHGYGGMHMKNCYPNGGLYNPYSNETEVPVKIDNNNNPVYNWNYLPTSQNIIDENIDNNINESNYNSMRNRNIYEGIGNGLVQNAGNFYDLYLSKFGNRYDTENYGRINPSYLTPNTLSATELLRDSDREASASRYILRNTIGGNTGAYLANLSANQTANTLNKAKIRENINNTNTNILNDAQARNTMIKNEAERYNLDLKNRAIIDTEQNRARSEDIARQAVRGLGENLSASYKDYKLREQDQKRLALINEMFPNYKFNPNNFEFYYKSATQARNKKK